MPVETATEPTFGSVGHQMSKLMDQMQKGYYKFSPSETWTPDVNLYETESSYRVCVDLAGVLKEEIDLQVHGQSLTLRGCRQVPTPPRDGAPESGTARHRVHLMEIDHGQFVREVELPQDVQSDKITAAYVNGLLWIELPKQD